MGKTRIVNILYNLALDLCPSAGLSPVNWTVHSTILYSVYSTLRVARTVTLFTFLVLSRDRFHTGYSVRTQQMFMSPPQVLSTGGFTTIRAYLAGVGGELTGVGGELAGVGGELKTIILQYYICNLSIIMSYYISIT